MLDHPTWKLILTAAHLLSEDSENFRMIELIERVQQFDSVRDRGSIAPVIQGMTLNAAKGPPSPCGKPLFRVGHGVYRLARTGDDSLSKSHETPSRARKVIRNSSRELKARIVVQRVSGLIEEFSSCVEIYDEQAPFTRRGQYTMHRKTIDRRRALGSVKAALSDEEFLDDLYETLHAWGIGRRASKLVQRDEFGSKLRESASLLSTFERLSLEDEGLNLESTANQLWALIKQLGAVENYSLVVPNAKILHHLLPDLVPPMDRAWTGSFFLWSATAPQTEQEATFVQTFVRLGMVAQATNPSQYVGAGWRTSPTKILDNAVIGYCQLHGLASKISDLKVVEASLVKIAPPEISPETVRPLENVGGASGTELFGSSQIGIHVGAQMLDRGHLDFQENQAGVSFEYLFGPYLKNARSIEIIDPYIRNFHQAKNLMEFIEVVRKVNTDTSRVKVELLTLRDPESDRAIKQLSNLLQVQKAATAAGIHFEFDFDKSETIHDREVVVDSNWKIILGRGLDIYQFIADDPFNLAHKDQSLRRVKRFGVTYIRSAIAVQQSAE